MRKNFALLLVTVLVLGLVLSACERPATKGPVVTPTTKGEIPFPVATQPQIVKDLQALTQTAMAQVTAPAIVTSTPAFSLPTLGATATLGILSTPVPTATKVVFPSPTPGRPATYTLQDGETLYCLARRFDVDPVDLMDANGLNLTTAAQLSIGTTLDIPQSGSFTGSRTLAPHPDTFTVESGDTIGSIACEYGDVSPDAIFAANGLKPDTALTIGQVLEIP